MEKFYFCYARRNYWKKKKKKKNANFRNILRSNQAQISFIKRSNDLFVRVTRKFIQELARSSSWQVSSEWPFVAVVFIRVEK